MCYGLSKMSVANEMVKGINPYKRLLYVEFLEFISRIADEKYKGQQSIPLYQKIEWVLDDILKLVNVARREIKRRIEFVLDESDESVQEDDHYDNDDRDDHQHQNY